MYKELKVDFLHKNGDQQWVFGWLYVCNDRLGKRVIDHSGEWISPETMETAFYSFSLKSRQAGEMHEKIGVGRMIGGLMFTPELKKAMGIPPGILPDGAFIAFKIDDPEVWKKIKSGEYDAFSIGGKCIRNEIGAMNA